MDYDLPDAKGTEMVVHPQAKGFRGRIVAVSSHHDGNQALVASGAHAMCQKRDFRCIREMLRLLRWSSDVISDGPIGRPPIYRCGSLAADSGAR
jgi:hypothetical protein